MMLENRKVGYLVAAAMMAGLLVAGFMMAEAEPGTFKNWKEGDLGETMPTNSEFYQKDQEGVKRMVGFNREMQDEITRVEERYKELPKFDPPDNDRLTKDQVESYIGAYNEYIETKNKFKNRVVGKRPGPFRVFALAGMVYTFHSLNRLNALINHGLTEEEFTWIRDRMLAASLYALNYEYNNEQISEEERSRIEELRSEIYEVLGIIENYVGDDEANHYLYHPEKLARWEKPPRTNVELFLDNTDQFRYPKINFNRPYKFDFHSEAILEAAKDNQP